MEVKSYKDLRFWQTSKEVNLLAVKLVAKLPNTMTTKIIFNQLLRACFSVGANIAEGYGKYLGKEYSRFLQISLGSARETEYWLELLIDIYPSHKRGINDILLLNTETIKMLVTTLKTLRGKEKIV